MKRVIALLLCLVMVVCCLAACGGNDTPDEVHSHTYSETWSSDAVGHWYMATCECEDVVETKLAHADKNNDGACDVCEYKTACADGHSYSEDWTVDCTNHWNAADCGHIVPGANIAAHDDDDNDGKCDVCNYVINDIHVHYYDTAWTGNAEYHWHAALCEHGVEVADKAAHVLNAAGYCTVCDAKVVEINTADLAAVLAAAAARNDKVAYGDVIATEAVYGGTGAQTLEQGMTNKVHFALGNGESYIQYISFDMYGNYLGQEEQWYEDLGNDNIFGIVMYDGEYELTPITGAAQFLNGYNYVPGSIIPSAADDTSTLANMLSALYNQMKAGVRVSNATENVENGVYTFSYTYYSVNPQTTGGAVYNVELEYYNVDVKFTVNDDLVIDVAEFQVEVYRDWDMDSDLSYTYVDNGDGTVTISDLALKPTANPTYYTYSVAQTSGERTFTTPYPRATLIPTSFEFLYVTKTVEDDNGNPIPSEYEVIGDSFEILEGTYAKFGFGDIYPITASSKFLNSDDFTYTFVNNDPDSDARAWYDSDTILNGFWNNQLKLKIRDVGEYTVTLAFGDVTKTFTLKVVGESAPELGEDDASTINVATTDTYAYSDLYSYTATAAGTYTFNLPAGLGLWNKESCDSNSFTQPEMDFYDNVNGASVPVYLDANETYEFYVAATTKGEWVITVDYAEGGQSGGDIGGGDDIGGGESGSIAADISGTYYSGDNVLVINNDGTMTFTMGATVLNYTYSIEGDVVTYTLNGNSPYTADNGMAVYYGYLTFGTDGMPATFEYNDTSYALSTTASGGDEGGDTTVIYGTLANPYALDLGENKDLVVDQTVVDSYYLYCTLTVTEAGWYSFNGYWNCSGDNTVLESDAGVWIYAEAGTTLQVYKYVSDVGYVTVNTAKENMISPVAGSGDSAANGVSIVGEGTYGVTVDYGVCADGLYVNFSVTENGYYYIACSNYCNLITYNGVQYDNNTVLTIYAEVGETYSLLVDNRDYDYDWNLVEVTGSFFLEIEKLTNMTVGTNSIEGTGEYSVDVVISVETTGTYTISIEDKADASIYLWGDVICINGYDPWGGSNVYSVVVELEAGVAYTTAIYFPQDQANNYDPMIGTWTVTIVEGGSASSNETALNITGNNNISAADVTYAYTAESAGTLTLSYPAWVAGTGSVTYSVNGVGTTEIVAGTPAEIALNAGDKVVVTVVANGAYATLTATWSGDNGSSDGDSGDEGDGTESNPYIVTGATSFTFSADYYEATYVLVSAGVTVSIDGAAEFVTVEDGPLGTTVTPTVDTLYMIYADNLAGCTGMLTATVGSDEGDSSEDALKIGSTSVEMKTASYTYTATEKGTLTLTAGAALMGSATFGYTVNGGDPVSFEPRASVEIALNAGDKVVVTIVADEDYTSITAAWADGSVSNPYILSELPKTITVTGDHDLCYSYTATENTTIVVSYVEGGMVSFYKGGEIVASTNDATAMTYTYTVNAGETVVINPWTLSPNEVEYTYVVSVKEATAGGEGSDSEGGEGEGGAVTGVATYVSAAASNGRYMKVEIDAANGTMSITRSSSSGSFDGQTASTFSYSYDAATKTVTYVADGATSVTAVEFDENGAPTSVTYMGMAYTDYTVQA